jgi:SHS2 domain-containing protein
MVEHREVMLDARDDDLLLVDVLDEVLFVVETPAASVPSACPGGRRGRGGPAGFDLVPTDGLEPSGPSPKGISLSGLRLEHADGRWQAHALVDI